MVRNSHSRFLDISAANSHVTPSSTSYLYTSFLDPAKALSSISPLTLSPPVQPQPVYREESTRVQLQRQRLKEQHANALVSRSIPGLKTSAAFFASLRTNLRLNVSPPASPMTTPPSMRASAASLPPPSPLAAAADGQDGIDAATEDPLAGVPELASYQATTQEEKVAALRLVADGVAQMRQKSNSILILHPGNLAVLVGVMALAGQVLTKYGRDWVSVLMACAGMVMIYFAGVRLVTQKYIAAAETIDWDWLGDADVYVSKFGEEIIGALIVDWVTGEGRQKRKKAQRGEVRGWAVRMKYRGKGVGTSLLEDASRDAKAKGAECLEFHEDHANSLRVMPDFYNKPFDRREARLRQVLQDVFENSSGRSKRK